MARSALKSPPTRVSGYLGVDGDEDSGLYSFNNLVDMPNQ